MLKRIMMRKLATLLVTLLLLTTAAMAESPLPAGVQALIPAGAELIHCEWDDGLTEYAFRQGETRWEVTLRGETPLLLETRYAVRGAAANALNAQSAAAFVTGEVLHARAERDDGEWVWLLIVRDQADLVSYELNAETGEVIEIERYFQVDLPLPDPLPAELEIELDDGVVRWDSD